MREAFVDARPAAELTSRDDVLLTRRGNALYVHLKRPVRSDAVLLPPLDLLPAKAMLLNTGEELKCSTDLLPVHWRSGQGILRIQGLPRPLLDGSETLVIRLDFDQPLAVLRPAGAVAEFQG